MLDKTETGGQVTGPLDMAPGELDALYTKVDRVLPGVRSNASRVALVLVGTADRLGLTTKITVYRGIYTCSLEGGSPRMCRVGNGRNMNHAVLRAFAAVLVDLKGKNV